MPSHVSARDLISVCIITLLGAALALAGGSGGLVRADVSVFMVRWSGLWLELVGVRAICLGPY